MKVQFYGAAQRVTGSKHLITTEKGTKILLDCGLFQGINTTELNQQFGFDPKQVDYVILSHAHIDHTGLLPRLVRKGFQGKIFCTHATKSLCEVMLADSAGIQERDLERINKRRINRGEQPIEVLYTQADVDKTLSFFETFDYHKDYSVGADATFKFFDTGHILGSAGIYLTLDAPNRKKTLFFTGDIGRPYDKILRNPEPFPQADYIIAESTYGNRLHAPEPDVKARLLAVVKKTCVDNKGKVIIPAFSVDRTQELVYALDQLESEGKLPPIPVYVDSPLSVKATMVMKNHEEEFNQDILAYIKRDGDAFGFSNLHYITDVQDSKALNVPNKPCIIISSSGMAEAGRIKHHLKNNIEDARNTVLIVGYCSPNSLGFAIKSGKDEVRIFGDSYKVNASVEVMDSFSAHADYAEMIDYLKCQNLSKVKQLFLVHGEIETQTAFAERLKEVGFKNIIIPQQGEGFEL